MQQGHLGAGIFSRNLPEALEFNLSICHGWDGSPVRLLQQAHSLFYQKVDQQFSHRGPHPRPKAVYRFQTLSAASHFFRRNMYMKNNGDYHSHLKMAAQWKWYPTENGILFCTEINSVIKVVFQKKVAQEAIYGGSKLTHSDRNIRFTEKE